MKIFLLAGLLITFVSTSAQAQDYGVPVKHNAQPRQAYGAPLFSGPDSTKSPVAMMPSGATCYVFSQQGPWYRVGYENHNSVWAVARTLTIPGSVGHETAQPCPDANAVVVFTPDAPADAWRKACQALLAQGYALAQHEADLYTFATAPKALGKTMQLTVTGFAQPGPGGQGSLLTLSGSYTYLAATMGGLYSVNMTNVSRPAVFKGPAGTGDRLAYSAIDQVAHAYAGGTVKYALR